MTMSPIAGNIGVSVAPATKGSVASEVTYTGSVVPYLRVNVAPRVQGWLEDIKVDVGDKVQKDQPLVRLDQTELRERLAEVQAKLVDQQKELRRDSILVKNGAISQSAYDLRQAEFDSLKAQEQAQAEILSYTNITSPINGVVTDRIKLINPGELVQPGTELLELADLSRVRIQADVAELDEAKIHLGTPVVVEFPDLPAPFNKIRARVTTIYPQMDPVTRTTKVEALIPNPSRLILPDAYAVMHFVLEQANNAVLVPATAVVEVEGKPTVFTTDMVAATAHTVKTGIAEGSEIQILDGIKPGDMVIVDGARNVTDGQEVNVVSTPQAASAGDPHD